jgi:hypothetical protein
MVMRDDSPLHDRLRHLLDQQPKHRTPDGRLQCCECPRAAIIRSSDDQQARCRECWERHNLHRR